MYITEAVTIDNIEISKKYPYVRIIQFRDRLYKIVTASNVLYDVGEKVLFLPDGTKLPVWLLKQLNLWSESSNKGILGGKFGNVIKPYAFARDYDLFSSGFIIKAQNETIETPKGPVNIFDKDISSKLDLTYISKGNPYYFSGDVFLMDIPIPKNNCVDLEYAHINFLGKYVRYQEYLPGRKFYIAIHRTKLHHSAFGSRNNIYVCGDNYGKYTFLSNTKRNVQGNLFVKIMKQLDLERKIENYLSNNSTWNQITIGFVIKASAFGARNVVAITPQDNLVVVDIYINNVPFGMYLPQTEVDKFSKYFNIKTPEYLLEDFYSKEDAYSLVGTPGTTGVVVRTEDNYETAVLYSKEARMRFVHKNS